MEVIKIFENSGVLGAEYKPVYTHGGPEATAVCADEIEVEIPEGWKTYELEIGGIAVMDPYGRPHFINDVLRTNKANDPVFETWDKNGYPIRTPLKRVNSEGGIKKPKPRKVR